MSEEFPGPCIICGDTNYNLSCGGPTICPKCDCGSFDSATVLKQAKVIADLRAQLAGVAQAAPKYAALEDWLNEIEGYGVRAERIPPGAYPWIAEAWKLGAASSLPSTDSRCTCGGDPDQPASHHDISCPLALSSTHQCETYCALCDREHQLHEDAQGFHHVIKGERVTCPLSPANRGGAT